MSTTEIPVAAPAAPAAEAATPALDSGLLTDEQVKAIFGEPEPAVETPTVATPPAAEQTPVVAPAAEAAPELDLTALEELSKPEAAAPPVTPAAPSVDSEYLDTVQKILPNKETLGWAVDALQRTNYAANAAKSGNIGGILEALPFMKPAIQNAITEYVKANEAQIIEDYIRRNSPEARNPEVDDLKQRVAHFESLIANGARQNQAAQQQAEQQRQQTAQANAIKAIDTEITGLFDKVRFTANEADRRIVTSLFKVALAEDSAALQKALSGNLAAVKPVFAKVVKDYTEADKAKATARSAVQTAKPPAPILTGAGSAAPGDEALTVWERLEQEMKSQARKG